MIDTLNPEQRAAVTLAPQHALVLAGAGSGKTRVLTTRMAWLIQNEAVRPYELMAVTFTNKAAREMLTRITTLLPLDTRALWVGTFHGLCHRLLRAHYHDAGLPSTFQILDSADQLAAIKRLLKAHNIDNDNYSPRDVQRFINNAKEAGQRPGALETRDSQQRYLNEIYVLYEAQCQREGVVDFAELLLRTYELLMRNAAVREHYQRRFRHILVDEFQDTNTLQYQWLRLLAGGGAYLFAVGDDDQSIYAFRGANVGNMADFERHYAKKTVIRLEQNYRSYGHILDAANALISHNRRRLGKNLWTSQGAGEPIRVVEQPTDGLEAQWVVDEIRRLMGQAQLASVSRRDMAVLYRSNAQSRMLEHALFSAGIPYKVYGGLRFFERQEIKHALAYLRLVANPNDDMAWLRVVNFPGRGIGTRTIELLTQAAQLHDTSLYRAVAQVPGKGGANLAQFASLIENMACATRDLPLPELITQVLAQSGLLAHYQAEREGAERLANLNELVTAAAVFCAEENFDDLPAGAAASVGQGFVSEASLAGRMLAPDSETGVPTLILMGDEESASTLKAGDSEESMSTLLARESEASNSTLMARSNPDSAPIQIVREGEESVSTQILEQRDTITLAITPLVAFLSHAALEAGDNQSQAGQDAVQLMTVHAAKGLEFDTVFITGLEEGLFPHENSLSEQAGLEEERRLMYVAMTRARKYLYLSLAQSRMLHGQARYARRSRFLKEIPSQHLEWLTVSAERSSRYWAEGGMASLQQRPWGNTRPTAPARQGGSASAGVTIGAQHFRIGQGVRHARFGDGTIIALSGSGSEAHAQIHFQEVGTKTLALGIAKLDVIVG